MEVHLVWLFGAVIPFFVENIEQARLFEVFYVVHDGSARGLDVDAELADIRRTRFVIC